MRHNPRSKPAEKLDFGRGKALPPWLFDQSGGLQVSGDSGSGKSTFLCAVMVLLARFGHGFTCLDPHGDLVRKVKHLCLNMGESVRRRLYVVSPGDTSFVTKFNPLAVERESLDEYTWRAMVTQKCGHTARILLQAWGEQDFNSKPLLYKWVNRILVAAAMLRLPLAAVRYFLEVGSEIYHALTGALPDFLTRTEFAELADMRPRDREELIASTKNRFLGFLSNPIVEAALCCEDGTFSARRLIADNAIILCDLSHQNVLREEDQEIFANLWLSEILHAVFGTPEGQRVPHWLIIDELPVFASCAPLITSALRQVRKYLTRFVCAHQGVNFFKDQANDRLLHALVGQCGLHFVFRHIDPLDAKFFGEIFSLPSYSATAPKHVLRQKQQYQAGHRLVVLTDSSQGRSDSDETGGSEGFADSQTDGRTTDTSESTTRSQPEYDFNNSTTATGGGRRSGQSSSTGTSRSSGSNWSHSHSRSATRTFKQNLVPILKWRDVITSVTFLTPEEQTMATAAILSSLPTGQALLLIGGRGVRKVRIPLLEDPFELTPSFAARKIASFRQELLGRPAYDTPAALLERQEEFVTTWIARLEAVSAGGLPALASSPQQFLPMQSCVATRLQNEPRGAGTPVIIPPSNSPLTI